MSRKTAITIGNFDGVHLGHQRLVQRSREFAGLSGRVVALTFEPHPSSLLRPGEPLARLCSIAQKKDWLRAAGADEVVSIETTRNLLQLNPEAFIAQHIEPHTPSAIIEGTDFRFGHLRSGSIETLRQFGARSGVEVITVDAVEATLMDQSIVRVSSSLVRRMLERGRVADAALLLGRPYELRCTIIRGDQRGRQIGFPTMNLDHENYLLPADGIYCGLATLPDGQEFRAAISVGTKPTFGGSPRVCEAHLLDYQGPLDDYGFALQLRFTHWLRDQLKYDTVDALIDQLHRDIEMVRQRPPAAPAPPAQSPQPPSTGHSSHRTALGCAAS